jgi:hypothetical protein
VQLDSDFTVAPLRFPHAGQGDELAGDSRIFYSWFSYS